MAIGDIDLGCSALSWGPKGFVDAVGTIARIGYVGIEASAQLVTEYEDRLHVFEEILDVSKLKLTSMFQYADFLNPETAEIEVERVANTARFLSANKSECLVVSPSNLIEEDLTADDWTTVAAVLEEMGNRCDEFGILLAFSPRAGHILSNEKDIKRVFSMVDDRFVNLCFDTAEIVLSGINPDRLFRTYRDRIIYTRLRDVSGAKRRKPTTSAERGSAPLFGRGAVDFPKIAKMLQRNEFTGWSVVETLGESAEPAEACSAAYRFIMRKSGLFM